MEVPNPPPELPSLEPGDSELPDLDRSRNLSGHSSTSSNGGKTSLNGKYWQQTAPRRGSGKKPLVAARPLPPLHSRPALQDSELEETPRRLIGAPPSMSLDQGPKKGLPPKSALKHFAKKLPKTVAGNRVVKREKGKSPCVVRKSLESELEEQPSPKVPKIEELQTPVITEMSSTPTTSAPRPPPPSLMVNVAQSTVVQSVVKNLRAAMSSMDRSKADSETKHKPSPQTCPPVSAQAKVDLPPLKFPPPTPQPALSQPPKPAQPVPPQPSLPPALPARPPKPQPPGPSPAQLPPAPPEANARARAPSPTLARPPFTRPPTHTRTLSMPSAIQRPAFNPKTAVASQLVQRAKASLGRATIGAKLKTMKPPEVKTEPEERMMPGLKVSASPPDDVELGGLSKTPLPPESPREGARPGNRVAPGPMRRMSFQGGPSASNVVAGPPSPPPRVPPPARVSPPARVPPPQEAGVEVWRPASEAVSSLTADITKSCYLILTCSEQEDASVVLKPDQVITLRNKVTKLVEGGMSKLSETMKKQREMIQLLQTALHKSQDENRELMGKLLGSIDGYVSPYLSLPSTSQPSTSQPPPPTPAAAKQVLVKKEAVEYKPRSLYTVKHQPLAPRQAPLPARKAVPGAKPQPSGRSAGHHGLNIRRKPRPKLAAGPSRRPVEELYPELPENLYKCDCYAPKPLIYDQLGISKDICFLHHQFAAKAGLTPDMVRVVQVHRTQKIHTARGAISVRYRDIKSYVARGEEKILLLVCKNEGHSCDAKFQICLVVVWDFWENKEEADHIRSELLSVSDNLEPLKRKTVETDSDMIHEDNDLGATYFAGCGWNRFQKNGGCKWSKSEKPRRFDPYDDPDVTGSHSTYSQLVYSLADRCGAAMQKYVPTAYDNMVRVGGHQCRLGDSHRIFSSGSINADACLKPHRDRRDTRDGCGALLSWQVPERSRQLHYIINMRLSVEPDSDGSFVAIDLGYGSLTFEVAGIETHATTPPEAADRADPARLSYVLFQHKGLDRPLHGSKRTVDPAHPTPPS